MRRLSLQDLRQYACATHEGAQAYDYGDSHPLIHLTFTFGSALFTDGFYETEQEQVRRFAQALVAAARVEPAFPWQYGAWMRDPVEGKGNRIQGSLVPALLDALLDETEHTERYVERCLSHRPDDLIAFVAHYRDLGLGAPSAAARRGMARALGHFDEYQLLKYARASAAIRLCDVILMLRGELEALGEPGALALAVGRVLHAPTRLRDDLLAAAAQRRDGLVPLPLFTARRALFELGKDQVDDPRFGALVAEARVTWEQVVGQFGRSVKLAPAALRALTRVAGWKVPQVFVPSLWRLAYLPKLTILEAAEALEKRAAESATPQLAALKAALQRRKGAQTLDKLEALVHDDSLAAEARDEVLAALAACLEAARDDDEAALWQRIPAAAALSERIGAPLNILRITLAGLRTAATARNALDALRQPLDALAGLLADTTDGGALHDEARALTDALRAELRDAAAVAAFVDAVALHERRTGSFAAVQGRLATVVAAYDPLRPIDVDSLRLVHGLLAEVEASKAVAQAFVLPASEGGVLRGAVERLAQRHEKLLRAMRMARAALGEALGDLASLDALRAHNRKVWAPLLSTPGLLGDTALMRNLRNIHTAGAEIDAMLEAVRARSFRKIWPHQAWAGASAAPWLEPVFEAILQKMTDKLPAGRHLGIADASGSMSCPLGGKHSSVTCMDVAFCLTALMSETSGLGASFSDGSWGGTSYLCIAERPPGTGMLEFGRDPQIRAGMGGTHVFGAVMELIAWLKRHDQVAPPDCLWFFSDMQFHPPEASIGDIPKALVEEARALGLDQARPPLELAIEIYRRHFGAVDVVLWNLAAYAPVPVPATMPGVLLVSGFDANTLRFVDTWRQGSPLPDAGAGTLEVNQEVILDVIRRY